MTFLRKLANLLPWVRRAQHRDIDEELRSIRELAGDDRLGNFAIAAEDARGALGWLWMERLGQDVRYALRSMRHHVSFTLLVVASLGLGIGANTAIFSFMEAVLLRSLPVADPESLVIMKWRARDYTLSSSGMSWSTGGSVHDRATGVDATNFPYPALQVFQDSTDVLDSAFGYFTQQRLNVTSRDATDSIKAHFVTGAYFSGIGVAPIAGRVVQPGDDAAGAAPVAVVSERFARRRFGTPQDAVGQSVRVNDKPVIIVGVAPVAFFGAEPGATPDLYMPLPSLVVVQGGNWASYGDPHYYWFEIMGRLKAGVDLASAQAALAPRFRQYVESTATTDEQRKDLPNLYLQAGGAGLDSLRRDYAQPIYVLMAMVGLILLIACSNIANLLLTRASARRREIAIRLSIGAGRARVVRQLLTESILLAVCGGLAGIALAWWGIDVLTALLSGSKDNFTLHAALNWRVLGVTAGLSLLTGVLFGLVPALQATKVQILPALKDIRAAQPLPSSKRLRIGSFLIAVQVALSVLLLVGAGLFGRTLAKLHGIDVGFNRDRVLLFTLAPASVGYRGADRARIFDEVRARLSQLPGVADVSLSNRPVPAGGGTMAAMTVEGLTAPSADGPARRTPAVIAQVGPAFFKTLQMPIAAGRDFTVADDAVSPKVVIVNKMFARQFGVTDPAALVGRTVVLGASRFEIVGVADDALAFMLKEDRKAIAYFAYQQMSPTPGMMMLPGQMTYELRTSGEPMALAQSVRDVVRQVDARLAIHELKTQAAHIDQAITREITLARLGAVLAGLALVIACVGLYGTVAFNVARRTNEIGIRMALGAPAARIVRMVMGEVFILAGAGIVAGTGLSLLGSTYLKTLLYGVEPNDPTSIALAIAMLSICGVIAAFMPARRAAGINPIKAVRQE